MTLGCPVVPVLFGRAGFSMTSLRSDLPTLPQKAGGRWGPGLPRYNHVVHAALNTLSLAEDSKGKRFFRRKLLDWYDRNRRVLPWRRDHDPYRVWVSEIMLQQTRVAAMIEHYKKFLHRFPTIEKLAGAREASVLVAWSGLGYYRRARMLHAAAKRVAKEHGGRFPASAKELRALPGIGRYTSAAIASIAYGEPIAVVDGNVERVLERLLGGRLAEEESWENAEKLLDRERPGDFNQAMMELGATICLPRQPLCLMCPVNQWCGTRGELEKTGKGVRQIKKEIYYALDCRDGLVFLVQRPKDVSLMPGMWELPEMSEIPGELKHARNDKNNGKDMKAILTLRHSITVTDYAVRVRQTAAPDQSIGKWIVQDRIESLPLTGLARKILRTAKVI
jgi:A/G-specific adenine glycosylase